MNNKKISAVGIAVPATETKNFTVKSITRKTEKIKCAVTTEELSGYQKFIIKTLYRTSRYRTELVGNLKKLRFCTYEVAVKSLLEQKLIFVNDYDNLMTEV